MGQLTTSFSLLLTVSRWVGDGRILGEVVEAAKCGCGRTGKTSERGKTSAIIPPRPQPQNKISRFPRELSLRSLSNNSEMKIKALSRPTASVQTPGTNVTRLARNLDPNLHPFERAREYTRALNATKLDRMFAAPFLGDFQPGHVDGVYSFAKDPESYAYGPWFAFTNSY
jgi:hypothetical protein